MPVPRGRKSRPTTASRTEDLPEDWDGVVKREERTRGVRAGLRGKRAEAGRFFSLLARHGGAARCARWMGGDERRRPSSRRQDCGPGPGISATTSGAGRRDYRALARVQRARARRSSVFFSGTPGQGAPERAGAGARAARIYFLSHTPTHPSRHAPITRGGEAKTLSVGPGGWSVRGRGGTRRPSASPARKKEEEEEKTAGGGGCPPHRPPPRPLPRPLALSSPSTQGPHLPPNDDDGRQHGPERGQAGVGRARVVAQQRRRALQPVHQLDDGLHAFRHGCCV